MTMDTQVMLEGLCFGEGPRWRRGELWLSDMHAHQVLRMDSSGLATTVTRVEA